MYIPRFQTNPLPLDSSQHFFPFVYFLNTFYVYFIQSNLAKNITNTLFSSIPYFCQTDTAKTGLISLRYATMHAYIHHAPTKFGSFHVGRSPWSIVSPWRRPLKPRQNGPRSRQTFVQLASWRQYLWPTRNRIPRPPSICHDLSNFFLHIASPDF